VIAVSHDRAFLRALDRFLLIEEDGAVTVLGDHERAMAALLSGTGAPA
jgi:ATPase subunit of ABC transporter with duplicated ATPase domains